MNLNLMGSTFVLCSTLLYIAGHFLMAFTHFERPAEPLFSWAGRALLAALAVFILEYVRSVRKPGA